MEALSLLMPLMQMGMSGSQSMVNTGMGLIPTVISMADRFRARTDPLMRRFSQIIGGRYNQAVSENPYGDPYDAWGGMFGTNDAGNSIGVGEAQARAINQMMQQNPAVSSLANYQQLAQAQRPDVVDTTSGLSSLMGHPSSFSGYEQPNFTPQAPDMGAALNTDFSGSPAPRDTSSQEVNSNLFGRGGVGSNLVDIAGNLASNVGQGGGGGGGGGLGTLANLLSIGNSIGQFRQNFGQTNPHLGTMGQMISNVLTPGMAARLNQGGDKKGYLFGTPFVPRTGQRLIHRGEQITPASMNPNNVGGQPAPGVNPGEPMLKSNAIQPLATPAVATADTAVPNTMMQLLQNPMSLSPEIQGTMINRGLEDINTERAAYDRRLREQSAGMGRLGAGSTAGQLNDLNQAAWVQGQNLRRDIPIEAARTNTNDLRQAASLQLGGEQALANQQLQQNQMLQGLYNQDITNQGRIIDSMNSLANQGIGNQLGWWNQLNALANQGINFSTPFLQSAIQNQMWRIQPSQIAQAPVQTQGATIPMMNYGGGSYGYGGGGGGVNYAPLVNSAMSYWASQ